MKSISYIACTFAIALTGLAASLPAFEVASIKPIDRTGVPGHGNVAFSGPRVNFNGYTLTGLIMYAYDMRSYQISGGPSWMGSDTFMIAAKAEGNAAPAVEDVRKMLQTLLADRFEIRLHNETREAKVYLMEPAKTGFKLEQSKAPKTTMSMGPGHLTMGKATAAQIASLLSSVLNRPVLDRSGAAGEFDFALESPDIMMGRMAPSEDNPGPSIFTAIQEQWGLKLEPSKGSIETLVIDHATKPNEN
jgi:uncharacterized protein (TIGR03435 family)